MRESPARCGRLGRSVKGEKCEKNVNQIVSGLILLNKPNTELRRFIRKKNKKMVQAGFEPQSLAWLLATLPIEPCKHLVVVVYCTYLTHFRTLQLYDINNITWYIFEYLKGSSVATT